MAEQKQREPFRSSVTNFSEIRKRMDELGIKPVVGDKDGVDTSSQESPQVEPGHYHAY